MSRGMLRYKLVFDSVGAGMGSVGRSGARAGDGRRMNPFAFVSRPSSVSRACRLQSTPPPSAASSRRWAPRIGGDGNATGGVACWSPRPRLVATPWHTGDAGCRVVRWAGCPGSEQGMSFGSASSSAAQVPEAICQRSRKWPGVGHGDQLAVFGGSCEFETLSVWRAAAAQCYLRCGMFCLPRV
jgi:hypothetical protein